MSPRRASPGRRCRRRPVSSCPERRAAALPPRPRTLSCVLREPRRVMGEILDARAETGEARIGGLALHVAEIDLLNDDGDLEDGEDLVVADVGDVAARARRVALEQFVAREIAGTMRYRGQRIALLGWGRRRPIGEQDAEIDQRVAQRAHLPVEYR